MKDDLLQIGKIVNTHGIKGDVSVVPWADYPEVLLDIKEIFIEDRPYIITRSSIHKNNVILHLKGIQTIEEAEKLRDRIICVSRDYFELEEGEYFWEDLLGLQVEDLDSGRIYGTLTDIVTTGANDCYEVTDGEGKAILFPAIADSCIKVDLEAGRMYLRPLPGLLDI